MPQLNYDHLVCPETGLAVSCRHSDALLVDFKVHNKKWAFLCPWCRCLLTQLTPNTVVMVAKRIIKYLQCEIFKITNILFCRTFQGPAGYTPVCNCGPLMKRLEQKMDGDRANMYDHIDASHRTLGDRIDHLDRRAAQQIYALDKLTRERIESERQDLQDRMEKRFLRERLESDRQMDRRGEHIRTEIKAWVDNRLTNIEQQHGNFHADCCDDLLHGRNHRHSCGGDVQPGALYRSKSDETLSISSTHPTKKHARLYAKAIHDLKKMRATGHKMDKRIRGIAVRDHPVGAQNTHCGRPMTFHEDLSPIAGRSPEGHSGNGEFSELDGQDSMKFNSTTLVVAKKI